MKNQAAKNFWSKGMRLSAGVDPTMLTDLAKVGGYYLEGGIREFAPWSKKMIDDFGDGIKPYLPVIYEQLGQKVPQQAARSIATSLLQQTTTTPEMAPFTGALERQVGKVQPT